MMPTTKDIIRHLRIFKRLTSSSDPGGVAAKQTNLYVGDIDWEAVGKPKWLQDYKWIGVS